MTHAPTTPLNDGRVIPMVGLGVWKVSEDEALPAIRAAFESGYKLIDTASIYANERAVGDAIRACGVPRNEIFLTTKVWNDRQGYDEARRACDESLKLLGTDYVDLYLIHWPAPKQGKFVDTWRALVALKEEGRARSIGVSNFNAEQIERIADEVGMMPAVNQIELHPFLAQRELREFHAQHGVVTQAWSPLAKGKQLNHPVLDTIASAHGRTPAQVVLRWHIQHSVNVIPKSVTPSRIAENIALFDFQLTAEEMLAIDGLDAGQRVGPDPATFP